MSSAVLRRNAAHSNSINRQSMRRTIIKQGYLKKLPNAAKIGASFKKPERRWFIFGVLNMTEPYLEYYRSEDSIFAFEPPINIIFLNSCKHIARNCASGRYSHMFTVVLKERELRLVALTRQNMKEWCDALEGRLSEMDIIEEPGTGENDYIDNPVSRPVSRLEQTRRLGRQSQISVSETTRLPQRPHSVALSDVTATQAHEENRRNQASELRAPPPVPPVSAAAAAAAAPSPTAQTTDVPAAAAGASADDEDSDSDKEDPYQAVWMRYKNGPVYGNVIERPRLPTDSDIVGNVVNTSSPSATRSEAPPRRPPNRPSELPISSATSASASQNISTTATSVTQPAAPVYGVPQRRSMMPSTTTNSSTNPVPLPLETPTSPIPPPLPPPFNPLSSPVPTPGQASAITTTTASSLIPPVSSTHYTSVTSSTTTPAVTTSDDAPLISSETPSRPALPPLNFPVSPAPRLVSLPSFEESTATPNTNHCPVPYTPASEGAMGAVGGASNATNTPMTPNTPLSPKALEAMGFDSPGGNDDAVGGWNMPPPENMEAPPPYLPKKMLERNANRSLKMTQVEKLQSEMDSEGVQIVLRKIDCYHALGLVDCLECVWVAGWNQKARPYLSNSLHVGDQLISVNSQVVESTRMAHKLIKHCHDTDRVTLSVRRIPLGKVFAIKRQVNGESLGITRNKGTAEIVTVHPEGLAAQHGVTPKTLALDRINFTNWWLTEVNHRPINMTFKDSEIEHRLNAVGKDISIVIQPADFILALKSRLKATYKNYKDFLVQ